MGLPAVGQGGLFDALAPPGAAPPKPRKYEPLTPELAEFIERLWGAAETNALATRLALRAGIGRASQQVHDDVAYGTTPRRLLVERLAILEELGDRAASAVVRPHLTSTDAEVQKLALAVLARVGGADTGAAIVKAYPAMPAALKPRAREVLFGRVEWAKGFLALVDVGKVAARGRAGRTGPVARAARRRRDRRGRAQALGEREAGHAGGEARGGAAVHQRPARRPRRRREGQGALHQALRRVSQAVRRGRHGRPGHHQHQPGRHRVAARERGGPERGGPRSTCRSRSARRTRWCAPGSSRSRTGRA